MSRAGGPQGWTSQAGSRWAGLALSAVVAYAAPGQAAPDNAGVELASYAEPLPSPIVSKTSPASRLAGLSGAQCLAEVARRKLSVSRFRGAAVGVATPVRVTGPIGGVRFVTPGGKSPYGILDCRLALALSELAPLLQRYDVVEARIDNMYRPHAHLPGKKKPSQHSFGLAADLTRLKRADGSELVVERDFQGAIGEPVCGEGARARAELSSDAAALRDLVCQASRAGLFHHILTPNHDQAHRDHFHLDIARGARQRLIE
ncbi:MAG: extensin family protein [Myxococcales bacterium]